MTNTQYGAFLAAKGTDIAGQPTQCAFNTSYAPSSGWPAPANRCNHPVVYVDWCDAFAYCAWAGKRLCGHPDGGVVPYAGEAYRTTSTSQWFAACSANGANRFAYGTSYIPGNCVDDAYDGSSGFSATTDVARAVGTAILCKATTGAFAELRDITGNVREWEDSCDDTEDGDDDCRVPGGSYTSAWDKAECDEVASQKRRTTLPDLGFRCCSQ